MAKLKRSLGFRMLTVYGVGTIVGGGFYALVGRVAAEAGLLTPLAFFAAAALALFSAFSYGELAARYPCSAGEARYVDAAFRSQRFGDLIGWSVVATGVVSAATLSVAFAGFLSTLTIAPEWLSILALVILLGLVAAWGINQSAVLALVITCIEIAGLLAIVGASAHRLPELANRWEAAPPLGTWQAASSVLVGAYLAFYSFIGFEDMVNLAEEVKEPERNLPRAILAALLITTVIYLAVTLCVVAAVDQTALAASKSPLSLVFTKGGVAAAVITIIAMLSGINGALVQIVMASRVAYGMAQRGAAPKWFANVSPRTQTPLAATAVVTLITLMLAMWFPLDGLAKATSTILLLVYAAVNLSLLRIKLRPNLPASHGPSYPIAIPIVGAASCLMFVAFHTVTALFSVLS